MKVSSKLPAIQKCIDQLEGVGFKVHLRYNPTASGVFLGNPYCGTTTIEFSNSELVVQGNAYCTINDQFDRSQGTRFAFNRAVHELRTVTDRTFVKSIFC